MALAPRIPVASQCRGLAGVGEFVLDVALATGSAAHRRDAVRIAEFILLRTVGPAHAPLLPDHTVQRTGHGWATGSTGVLSFLRRLADPVTPRLWPASAPAGGAV